jgi:hypothetical protein
VQMDTERSMLLKKEQAQLRHDTLVCHIFVFVFIS